MNTFFNENVDDVGNVGFAGDDSNECQILTEEMVTPSSDSAIFI